ncbi:uncharacterized protein LOC118461881 isoform X2 [Anopheles albimanus]|uniref:Uncharacterized protein n=1 Tax=Anopheles albimanus TaxID=7167 RepID=A0A182F341_ANOAL|nr:uncharacterized protein LOC118461881 isoform X2 [Anopheles albimanus]
MKFVLVSLIAVSLQLGCEALYGIEVSPNIPEATTVTSACSKLSTVSQQIISSVSYLKDLPYGTLKLQTGATALYESVTQNYTTLVAIWRTIDTATNANSGSLDSIFTNLQSSLATFGNATMSARFAGWLQLLNTTASSVPNLSLLPETLANVSTFYDSVLGPRMKQFTATRISQATFYNGVPKDQMVAFAQSLASLAQNQETIVLPFINRVVGALRLVSEKQTAYLAAVDQAFQNVNSVLSMTYTRFLEQSKMSRQTAGESMPSIRTAVDQFTGRMAEFNDLYLGGSATDYIKAASDMYQAFLLNNTEQTQIVSERLERVQYNFTENPLVSMKAALSTSFDTLTQTLDKVLPKTANSSSALQCATNALNDFVNTFGNHLRDGYVACVSSNDYDYSLPANVQGRAMKDIQSDMLQYFNQLNGAIGGLSNTSPASSRIQADTFLTAFFSQSLDVMTTILQQLVNASTKLLVDYNLLIGRSRYCLAQNVAVSEQTSLNLAAAIDAC